VHTLGFPHEFLAVPWADLLLETRRRPGASYLEGIVSSITTSRVSDSLAGALWMNDLAVAATPIRSAPIDVIVISTEGSLRAASAPGLVRIEHVTTTGRNDAIERSVDDSVALFWRFAIEKFGIAPA
jgi:hypothetical protein